MSEASERVADSVGNWVDDLAPDWSRPYLRLARFDRPIGAWLLLLPCWWSAALAGIADGRVGPRIDHLALFFVGAFVMRGAGCTWNDIVDRNLDGSVARTRSRPIPSGRVSVVQATAFMAALALVGLAVLLQFNWFTVATGLASLGVVAIYPFMKRITYWPQVVLGLAFSWGALMGWPAVFGRIDLSPVLLYAGSIVWVIAYDTIYAHQDREDDVLIGIKSTARLFAERTPTILAAFYTAAVTLIGAAAFTAGAGVVFALGLAAFAGHLAWQVRRLDIDDSDLCLMLFKSNRDAGLILFAALTLDALVQHWW
ncbi:4-hydroxybenzoate octaprenyltransferase [Xanthobacteraceae bacterium Astr-EGSB]|uniref:4-hydroxybenzoate octaprenyltransferase n=1 Tax=Astrobacterium formosum TaxID=3069710 RepID=UPI0027B60FD9|nr:4-hydroxybenzoate octaprenyltransferase [Xanthobacteraceae bacterium Astr-EGSB]